MEIMRRILTAFTLLSISGPCTKASEDSGVCGSPQYLELGIPGIISCNLRNEYFAIFWTNSSDHSETPLVSLKKEKVAGRGYESGEFDVYENGSLVINLVTVEHEHVFTLLLFPTSSVQFDYYNVDVITTAHPSQKRPYISQCDSEEDVCLKKVKSDTDDFQCSVVNARPEVDLEWQLLTKQSFQNVSGDKSVFEYNKRFTTNVTIVDVFHQSSMAVLLACVEVSRPGLLQVKESFLLALNGDYDIMSTSPEQKIAVRGTDVKLACSKWNATFMVWTYKHLFGENSNIIMYTLRGDDSFISKPSSGYRVDTNGSLMIDEVDIPHEGVYSCISGDGEREVVVNYNISIYVSNFPVVSGCSSEQYCVMTTHIGTGTLTCKLAGIRPSVQLEFRAAQESHSQRITFTNPERTVHDKGDIFDVTLTSDYRVTTLEGETRITIECGVFRAKYGDIFGRPAKLDIHFIPQNPVTHSYEVVTSETSGKNGVSPLWLLLLLAGMVLCSAALIGLLCFRKVKRSKQPGRNRQYQSPDSEEMLPIFSDGSSDKIWKFINALKVKYGSLYNAVHPLPYIRDRMYSVDKVFVESGIQVMKTPHSWIELETYHDAFKNPVNQFSRTILEGEPGFGKSILSLQLLYDWCNKIPTSPLRNVQILIFLQLRQLGGGESISEAVKKFILPKDSDFSEDEIGIILQNCPSIFIILDGFDEYPDQENASSEIRSIIKGEMLQQASVLLTTRSKCIPKSYAPQSKRMRLDGFSNRDQKTYIQKAVVDDPARADSILRRLNENTVVSDLCQIPLFFAMFAHMTHEDEKFQEFRSVSTCFRYVIGCFHAHLRNKTGEQTLPSFESDHKALDQVAYEALNGHSQQIVWNRDALVERMEEDCYRYYVQVGILVEEEVLDHSHKFSSVPSSLVQYETKVRFFHKIVCEWYAAHHFVELISDDPSVVESTQMNLFDLQYLFRFACGFNRDAARHILSYVSEREDGERFKVLCFLEQTGDEENVLETITRICSSEVIFDGSDTKLLQRSTVQLLEMASSNNIEVIRVEFYNCIKSVDLNLGNLILSSDIEFHKLSSISQLVIYEEGKLVEANKARNIIKFGSLCHGLQTLAFYRCMMPHSLGRLHQNFSVWWSPSTDTRFYLTRSGGWETTDKKKVSTAAYKEEVRKFKESQKGSIGNHTRVGEDEAV